MSFNPKIFNPQIFAGLPPVVGWLDDWDKRIKITLDHDDVDVGLTDFPVLVYLSVVSGRNADDVTCVFDELGSNANRKKIAVTKDDGTTQLYVEIEKWDHANEKAWLWVGAPNVAADVDTVLYLYYDNTHADNDDYVGDTKSVPAQNVWVGYGLVSHLNEINANDSTSNNNDGTAVNNPVVVTGKIGNGVSFTGATRAISFGKAASLDLASQTKFTIEAWLNYAGNAKGQVWFHQSQGSSSWNAYSGTYALDPGHDNNNQKFGHRDTSSATRDPLDDGVPATGEWHKWVLVYDSVTPLKAIYLDGALVASTTTGEQSPLAAIRAGPTTATQIGYGGDYGPYNGWADEFRIMKGAAQTLAYIKATYESERDHLNIFETGEYTLTVNVVGGGSVSLDPSYPTYNYGELVELTAIADPGWVFDSWDDDLTGSVNPETLIMDGDKTITAIFTEITWTITASAGAGGSIDPVGPVVVADGGDQGFTITPSAGYHILDVLVDAVSVGAVGVYDFTGVTADHTIEASFEAELVKPIVSPPAKRRRRMVNVFSDIYIAKSDLFIPFNIDGSVLSFTSRRIKDIISVISETSVPINYEYLIISYIMNKLELVYFLSSDTVVSFKDTFIVKSHTIASFLWEGFVTGIKDMDKFIREIVLDEE